MHRTGCATSNHLSAPELTLNRIGVRLKRGISIYQAFGKSFAKIALGVFVLSFFSIYQPSLQNFPIQKSTVYAQENTQQTQIVTPSPVDIQFQLPHPGYLSTPFSNYHPGIDIATGLGMPIRSIAKGVVVEAGFNLWGLGLVVEVEHAGAMRSLYAHMGKIYVEKGKEVEVNDLLGEVGLTGNTSGPHTHLELSKDGHKIDPRPLLPELRNYPKEEDFAVYQSATPSAVIIPASASAIIISEPVQKPTANQLQNINTFEEEKPTEEAVKDLKEEIAHQNLENILTVTKPTPSETPSAAVKKAPTGGKIVFLDVKSLLHLR